MRVDGTRSGPFDSTPCVGLSGSVDQELLLLAGAAPDNLGLGDPSADEQRLRAAYVDGFATTSPTVSTATEHWSGSSGSRQLIALAQVQLTDR